MQARHFVRALLDPVLPVPVAIRGQPQKRFAVYRNNVIVGLVNALAANFPVIQKLLGTAYFSGLANEFVRLHPPHSRMMFQYGDLFPHFLAMQTDLNQYPYLHDVAQAEILMRQAYHAADAEGLSATKLATINNEQLGALRFATHPSVALFQSPFAVASIIRSNLFNDTMHVTFDTPENIVISRKENVVQISAVENPMFALISNLIDGKPLADAADVAFAMDDAFDLGAALAFVLSQDLFTDAILPEPI